MRHPRFAFFGLFAIAASFAGVLNAQTADPAPPPTKIAVINLRLVYENMQETIDSANAVKDLQAQVDKLTSAAAPAKQSDEDALRLDLQAKTIKARIIRMQAHQLVHAYAQIKAVVADLAMKKGLDLVAVNNGAALPPNAGDIPNADTLGGLVFNRSALHTSDEVDISAEVIELLNKGYTSTASPLAALPITPMQIGSKTFQLEIAGDDASREHGLMERDTIAPDHGMIFVFPVASEQNFWMHHTRFPLDIIFVDDHARVVSIKTMKPYDETAVPSDGTAKYAIELPGGQAAGTGVKPGDQLSFPAAVDAGLKK